MKVCSEEAIVASKLSRLSCTVDCARLAVHLKHTISNEDPWRIQTLKMLRFTAQWLCVCVCE